MKTLAAPGTIDTLALALAPVDSVAAAYAVYALAVFGLGYLAAVAARHF